MSDFTRQFEVCHNGFQLATGMFRHDAVTSNYHRLHCPARCFDAKEQKRCTKRCTQAKPRVGKPYNIDKPTCGDSGTSLAINNHEG